MMVMTYLLYEPFWSNFTDGRTIMPRIRENGPESTLPVGLNAVELQEIVLAASNAGMNVSDWVGRALKDALFRQKLQEIEPDAAESILAGLEDFDNGHAVSHREVRKGIDVLFGRVHG
jgi:hypothetical protein